MKLIYALAAGLLVNTTNVAMHKGKNKTDPLNVVCKMPSQDILLRRLLLNGSQGELGKIAGIVVNDSHFTNWRKNIAEKSLQPLVVVYQAECAAEICYNCALQNGVQVDDKQQYIQDNGPVILQEILLKDYPKVLQLLKNQPNT